MDIATILGLVLGFGAVIGGQILEGGHVRSILQPTAALIVLGGTFGATLVSFPMKQVLGALRDGRRTFTPPRCAPQEIIEKIVGFAYKARKDGLISLEGDPGAAIHPLMEKGIAMIVDGNDPQRFQEVMEIDMDSAEEHAMHSAEVFEAAGGFAPTIGIIGAVLGLIHVMENLSDPSKLGAGIAVAFVATIYGLVTANIICIPFGTKLKGQAKAERRLQEMILEGLLALVNGENPHLIRRRLEAFLAEPPAKEKKG